MNQLAATSNPFATGPVAAAPSAVSHANAIAASDQQRAIAEVHAAMAIARTNPRNPIVAMDRILNACSRPGLAESALYSYSRGGTEITGPSIRLAEALAQAWGNISYGIRELDQRPGESTVQAFAWDLETNTRREITFQVSHIRHTKKGAYALEDPRDIYELVANQGARRLRACILGILPGDVIEEAQRACEMTLRAKVSVTPELIASILEKFAAFGVTKEMIEKRIQRRIDAITPGLVVNLGKILNSLKDGMSVVSDWFEPVGEAQAQATATSAGKSAPPASRSEAVKEKARKAAAQHAAVAASEPPQAGESRSAPVFTFAQVADAIQKAQDADALDSAALMIAGVAAADQRAELEALFRSRRDELAAL